MKKKLSPGAALAAMRKTFKGRAKVITACPKCGRLCSARERRAPCPGHHLKTVLKGHGLSRAAKAPK
jgi:hypothetical protein